MDFVAAVEDPAVDAVFIMRERDIRAAGTQTIGQVGGLLRLLKAIADDRRPAHPTMPAFFMAASNSFAQSSKSRVVARVTVT